MTAKEHDDLYLEMGIMPLRNEDFLYNDILLTCPKGYRRLGYWWANKSGLSIAPVRIYPEEFAIMSSVEENQEYREYCRDNETI